MMKDNKLPEYLDESAMKNVDSSDHYLTPQTIDAQMRVLFIKSIPQVVTLILEKLPLMIAAAFFLLKGKG